MRPQPEVQGPPTLLLQQPGGGLGLRLCGPSRPSWLPHHSSNTLRSGSSSGRLTVRWPRCCQEAAGSCEPQVRQSPGVRGGEGWALVPSCAEFLLIL